MAYALGGAKGLKKKKVLMLLPVKDFFFSCLFSTIDQFEFMCVNMPAMCTVIFFIQLDKLVDFTFQTFHCFLIILSDGKIDTKISMTHSA